MTVEKLQEQVNGMLHNLETEDYIREWLRTKHSVEGERADSLLLAGWRDYRASVRKTSLMRLVVASLASVVLGAALWFNLTYAERVWWTVGGLSAAFFPCLAYAGKQAIQLVKGMEE